LKFTKFYKPNCDPCKFLSKVLLEINDQNFELEEIDITQEENKHYIKELGIERVPFLLSEKGNFLHGLKKPIIIKEFIKIEMEK
jgi:glutaredoxin